jgi:hypothetical protein
MPGMAGGGGAGGANDKDPDFSNALNGAQAFLDALKSKDTGRIADVIALRSDTEESTHRSLFKSIKDGSLGDNDLNDLAAKFDGMKPVDRNVIKSTARVGIICAKMKGQTRLQRTLWVRKEKDGWKVVDFGPEYEVKPQIGIPRRGMGGRRR